MTKLDGEEFYSDRDEAPQQGDILVGAVSRVVADDLFAPTRWRLLDETQVVLAPSRSAGAGRVPALRVAAGRALVMVCSHDCGLDKEFNAAVNDLMAPDSAFDEVAAVEIAEARADMDRNFSVSPLVDPASITVAGAVVDRGLLMSGRVVGYLPVPELTLGGRVVIPESVVDLGYRATIDRLAYTQRVSCVSERAREHLRFAMARLDVLRTPSLEVQLASAVGQTITSVRVPRANPLVVELTLADGTRVELLQKPGSPAPGATMRSRRSVPGSSD